LADQNFRVKRGLEVGIGGTVITTLSGGNVGLGSTNPTSKLDVIGDAKVSGVVTATTFIGALTGTATTAGIATSAGYASTAGVSTSVIGGIGSVTQLNVSGISTLGVTSATNLTAQQLNVSGLSTFSGITTYTTSLFGTQASFTGVVTALSFSGNASSASYATTAGVSTSVIGGIASVTQLNVSGISTLGVTSTTSLTAQQLNVSGVGTFQSSNLKIVGASTSFQYSIVGSTIAANRNLTIPLLSSDDTLAVLGLTQTFSGTNTFSGSVSITGSNVTINPTNATGNFTLGNTAGTGIFIVGQSTASQTTNIQAGASGVGTTKTINFGTGGLSGSFTQINIGPGPSAGVGTVVINSGTNLGIGSTTPTSALDVIGGAKFTGVVTATSFSGNASSASYASTAGIATYATSSGIATYATTAGVSTSVIGGISSVTQLNVSGISTLGITSATNLTSQQLNVSGLSTFAGITTYTTSLFGTQASFTGVVTALNFSGNASSASYASTAGVATALQNARNFSITGNFVTATAISFDGTGNVALAATIPLDAIGLGTYTTGDYVKNISGTSNQITVTGGTGEGSTPTLSIPSQFTAPQDATVTRDLQVNRNLNVTGNITIGGTSAIIYATELKVSDPDIVLGIRTDSLGNDISNDTTANHGGIAVASTEGNPLVSLYNPGIGESTVATYKKIMWFKSGSFAGLGTDAWLINYAVGIGSTQFPTGTRLAAGNVQFTQNDLAVVRNINASGVGTIPSLSGTTATYGTGNFTTGNIVTGVVTTLSGTTATYGTGNFTTGNIVTGVVTTLSGTTATYGTGNFTTGNIVTGVVTTLTSTNATLTNINSSGISTLGFTSATNLTTQNINNSGITTTNSLNIGATQVISSARQLQNISSLDATTTATIESAIQNAPNTFTDLQVTGVSTFTNGPVLVGTTTATGTASQNLQVSGSAYIAGDANSVGLGIGVTNATTYPLDIRLTGGATVSLINLQPSTGTRSSTIRYVNTSSSNMITGLLNSAGAGQGMSGLTAYAGVVGLTAGTTPLLLVTNALERVRVFDTGEVGIGTTTLTGTTNQLLQVNSGAYVSGNTGIGTTNPTSKLQVIGDANVSGIITTNSLNIGATQVISSARQLQNIASLDATTTATIEAAIQNAPNTFTDLNVTGISTLGVTSTTNLTAQQLNVSGLSTFSGIATHTASLFGTQASFTGVVTATTFNGQVNAGVGTITTLSGTTATYGTGNFTTGNIVTGVVTTLTSTNATLTNINSSGISTLGVTSATNLTLQQLYVSGLSTFAGITTHTASLFGTQASFTGVVTASSFSGNASSASYAPTAGIATYATSSGIATYATSSGIATYATTAGIATYATNAGTSTSVIGGIGSITQLQVTGISTFTNGPVLIGSATSTGTSNQKLQVTGGTYISSNVGIAVTSPSFAVDIAGDARVTSTNKMRFGGTAGTTNFYIQYNSTANSLDFVAG